jgi:hypothetical protein
MRTTSSPDIDIVIFRKKIRKENNEEKRNEEVGRKLLGRSFCFFCVVFVPKRSLKRRGDTPA